MAYDDCDVAPPVDAAARTAVALPMSAAAPSAELTPEGTTPLTPRRGPLGREVEDDFETAPEAVKILVAGGFGVGKTTLVGALTEIRPLRTEEGLSGPGARVDALGGAEDKRTTTVAMDFGRITISESLVVYLFGTPGQKRFWFMWDDLSRGALGAVVLADTRRLADCFPAIDYFEHRGRPFIVALNRFDGARRHDEGEVRRALDLGPRVPIVMCDARERTSCRDALVRLVDHAIERVS